MGFRAESFDAKKKNGKGREEKREGKWKGGNGFSYLSYVLSYVFKSAVELELFSKLWYFEYCPLSTLDGADFLDS